MPTAAVGLLLNRIRVTLHVVAVNHRGERRRRSPPRLTDPDTGLEISHVDTVATCQSSRNCSESPVLEQIEDGSIVS